MSIRKNEESRTQYLAKLRNTVQELSSKGSNKNKQNDDRYWKPEVDKAGQASAIIRFLPALSVMRTRMFSFTITAFRIRQLTSGSSRIARQLSVGFRPMSALHVPMSTCSTPQINCRSLRVHPSS